jgi:hypothetical protein
MQKNGRRRFQDPCSSLNAKGLGHEIVVLNNHYELRQERTDSEKTCA